MLKRRHAEVESALARQAAVGLLGPRQAGKSTPASMVAETRPPSISTWSRRRTKRYPLAEGVEAIGHVAIARELAQSL